MVKEWARLLRLPTHENDYPIKPRLSSCACGSAQTYTRVVFPGGSQQFCGKCRAAWLVLG